MVARGRRSGERAGIDFNDAPTLREFTKGANNIYALWFRESRGESFARSVYRHFPEIVLYLSLSLFLFYSVTCYSFYTYKTRDTFIEGGYYYKWIEVWNETSFFVKWRIFPYRIWLNKGLGQKKKKRRREAGHIYVWRACQWIKALAEKSSGSSGTKRKGVQIPIPGTLIWIRWTLSPRARTLFFFFFYSSRAGICMTLQWWSQVPPLLFLIHELNGNINGSGEDKG